MTTWKILISLQLDVWIVFDEKQKKFALTDYARKLEDCKQGLRLFIDTARFLGEKRAAERRDRTQQMEEAKDQKADEVNDEEMADAPVLAVNPDRRKFDEA